MTSLLPLLAQAAPPAGGGLGMFVPMILIMVMFYFILIRPQRKAQKAQEEMLSVPKTILHEVNLEGIELGRIVEVRKGA